MMKRWWLILLSAIVMVGGMKAANKVAMQDTTIVYTEAQRDSLWQQPDFVRAYLVVAEPGNLFYTVFGHACLHLVCDSYRLDYFFSYESENVQEKAWRFFLGQLKMGLICCTPEEFLSVYREEGRGVKEYEINLPIDIKRELWRVLDSHVAEGVDFPYDYEARGCAYTCHKMIKEALDTIPLDIVEWPSTINRTRREICYNYAHHQHPWNILFMMIFIGADVDCQLPMEENIIIPEDLVNIWQHATVNNQYLLSLEPHTLVPSTIKHTAPWCTPIMVSMLLLILSLVNCFWVKTRYLDWLILIIFSILSAFITYLVLFSVLPCNHWNWLLVPFNILPLVFWRWYKKWVLVYIIICVLWMIFIFLWPYLLVDPSIILLEGAFMICLIKKII